jgi:hypothetical protein
LATSDAQVRRDLALRLVKDIGIWKGKVAIAGPLVVAGLLLASSQKHPLLSRSVAPQGAWVALFNGRDLEGWVPKFSCHPLGENVKDTFRVEKGRLIVSYDNYKRLDDLYGHLFYGKREFSHYWIRAEYRFVGKQVPGAPDWAWRNNGVMLHAQPPETMTLEQRYPISFELRLMGGKWLHRRPPTGSLCLNGTTMIYKGKRFSHAVIDSDAPSYAGDQWVLAEAEVEGSKLVRYFINGRQVLEYSDLQLEEAQPWSQTMARAQGFIAIQAESHPTEFLRIEVLSLDKPQSGPKLRLSSRSPLIPNISFPPQLRKKVARIVRSAVWPRSAARG